MSDPTNDPGLPEEEWERRLRGAAPSPLPPPPGAFDRVRRTARRRRRVRAAGAGAAAALAAGLVVTPVAMRSAGFDTVDVRPPVAGAASTTDSAPPPQRATESSQVVPSGPADDPPGPGRTPSARPSTPGPARSTGPAAPLPACGTERLTGAMTDPVPGDAYGSRTAELVLTNVSPGSCVITGVPELALLDGQRAPIDTETAPPATAAAGRFVVSPGGTVRASLAWTTARQADELLGCYPVPAWLRIRPPGGLTWLETGWRGQEVCSHGRVEVGPLRRDS